MTYQVFPAFVGLAWDIKTRFVFSTNMEIASSGSKFSTGRWPTPLLEFDLAWNYLSPTDLNAFLLFLLQLKGPLLPFLIAPTNDCGVTIQEFGIGDGSTTAFQLINAYGYPITQPDAGETIYVPDWQGMNPMLPRLRTNHLIHSETLDHASWVNIGSSVTADTTVAPTGQTTADKIVEDSSTGLHAIQQSWTPAASTLYTFSVFVNAGSRTAVQIAVSGTASGWVGSVNPQANFDLTTGIASGLSAGTTATSTAFPGGWWRVQITAMTSGAPVSDAWSVRLLNGGSASYAGDGASNAIAWGAQVEVGVTATRYIVTTTVAVSVTDYTLSLGLVTFAIAPVNTAQLYWAGTYKYLVQFSSGASQSADTFEFNQMLSQMYEQGGLTMQLVR